jgi:hypothetical protein
MDINTAIAQINQEAEHLGLGLLETLLDIQERGEMAYSYDTMRAYRVFMAQGAKFF